MRSVRLALKRLFGKGQGVTAYRSFRRRRYVSDQLRIQSGFCLPQSDHQVVTPSGTTSSLLDQTYLTNLIVKGKRLGDKSFIHRFPNGHNSGIEGIPRRGHVREGITTYLRTYEPLKNHGGQSTKPDVDVRELLKTRRELLRQAFEVRKDGIYERKQRIRERGAIIMEDLRNTKAYMKEKLEKAIEEENIYTIPNLLCLTRIAFSPYLGYLIVTENFNYALAFMTIAGISDWLDGWIARNYPNQSSKFGSFLDPMADKVLIGTLFFTLTYVDLIPLGLTCLIVGRDLILVGAGFVIRFKSLPPPRTLTRYFDATHVTAQLAPTMISKVNTAIQLILVASTLAAPVFGYVGHPALGALCYITGASTIIAAISYVTSKDTFRYIRKNL